MAGEFDILFYLCSTLDGLWGLAHIVRKRWTTASPQPNSPDHLQEIPGLTMVLWPVV